MRFRDAGAGVLAFLAALGASELVAGLLGAPVPSLVESVADVAIDSAPPAVKGLGHRHHSGAMNKAALSWASCSCSPPWGAGIGVLARRSLLLAGAGHGPPRSRGRRGRPSWPGGPGRAPSSAHDGGGARGLLALRWLLGRGRRRSGNSGGAGEARGRGWRCDRVRHGPRAAGLAHGGRRWSPGWRRSRRQRDAPLVEQGKRCGRP
jgi:hypothetical protein